jgi:predicted dehydrogenase
MPIHPDVAARFQYLEGPGDRAGAPLHVAAWWPPGHGLGWEHGFTHQVVDLITAIDAGHQPHPSFAEGLQVQRVLDAVESSAAAQARWTPVPGRKDPE